MNRLSDNVDGAVLSQLVATLMLGPLLTGVWVGNRMILTALEGRCRAYA